MLDELAGRRVALRHRIARDDAPGPRFSDAVGELTPDGPDAVVVHTRSGAVRVGRDAVVAVREVPPAPPRRASRAAVARLERVRSDAWPAAVRTTLGHWELRAAGGYTYRANSALVTGDPGVPVAEALARVRAFAATHGIDPVVQAPVGSPWSNRVLDAGWHALPRRGGESLVLVAPAGSPDGAPDWPAVPPPAWWDAQDGPVPADDSPAWAVLTPGAQSTATPGPGPLTPGAQSKATPTSPLAVGFGMIDSPDGSPAGSVRAAVVGEHVHLARLHVLPAHRGRGLAARLTRQALAWGAARGARHAVLEVAADNAAGRALFAREGWTEHHRYHYLVP